MPFFEKFTDQELVRIRDTAVRNEWPELIGPKPDGFDDLPDARPDGWRGRKIGRTKRDYTYPIYRLIDDRLGYDRIQRIQYEMLSEPEKLLYNLFKSSHGMRQENVRPLAEHLAKIQGWM